MTKLIFGCGYLGSRVAQRWHEAGEEVVVVTRSTERAADFERLGYQSRVADLSRPETLIGLSVAETVLFAVGFDRTGSQSIEEVYEGGMRHVLAALHTGTGLAETGRLLYISSTGVYGQADGGWVDEQTPPDPQRAGGLASLAAERLIANHPLASRSIFLRMAGIYGPGRIPYLDLLRAGEPIPAPQEGFLNLIHVDDAATVVLAAARWKGETHLPATPAAPAIFCVSDGRPVVRRNYYHEVARRIGAPEPRFTVPAPDSPKALRAAANRRIRNDHMIAKLDVSLAYPSYREGLAATLGTIGEK